MTAANVNERYFRDKLEEGQTLLVDYWAPWCGYCRRIGPAFDIISAQYQDQLTAIKINIDDNAALAEEERIEVIPTLVLYRNGKAAASIVAPESKAMIDAFLQEALAK